MEAGMEHVPIKVEAIEPEETSLPLIKLEYDPEFGMSAIIKEEKELIIDESMNDGTEFFSQADDPLEILGGNTNFESCEKSRSSRRALSCTQCSAKFTDKKMLMRHLMAHVDGEPAEFSAVSACSSHSVRKPRLLRKIVTTDNLIKVEGELEDNYCESIGLTMANVVKQHRVRKNNSKPQGRKINKRKTTEGSKNIVLSNIADKNVCLSSCGPGPLSSPDPIQLSSINSECIKLKCLSVSLTNIAPVSSNKNLREVGKVPFSFNPASSSETDLNTHKSKDANPSKKEEGWFSCELCPFEYKSKLGFQAHSAKHCREGQYSFSEYLAKFGKNLDPDVIVASDLQPESSSETDISGRKQSSGPKKSEPVANLQKARSSSRVLSCAQCSEKFTDKTVLMRHLLDHSRDCLSLCDDASPEHKQETFKNQTNSKVSDKSLLPSNSSLSACDDATPESEGKLLNNQFNPKVDAKSSLPSVSSSNSVGEKPLTAEFNSQSSLLNHSASHLEEKLRSCPLCPFKCKTKPKFTAHLKEEHPGGVFACSHCPEKFARINQLKAHEVIHTNEKPHSCPKCPARFKRTGDLNVHLKRHFGEAKFKCTVCPFQFFRRYDLNKHLRSHSNVKKYACPLCPCRYKEKYHLHAHMLKHSDTKVKKFSCTDCHLQFDRQSTFKRHSRVHSNSRSFRCSICSKEYGDSASLRAHVKVHATKNYSCAHCTAAYQYKQDVAKHLRKVHPSVFASESP